MNVRTVAILGLAPLLAAATARVASLEDALRAITPAGIRAHVAFLADDLLEGREPGTRGGRLAARYIAAQLMQAGVAAPQGGYFQPVSIHAWSPAPDGRSFVDFGIRGQRLRAAWGEQVIAWPGRADTVVNATAEVVFAGYGVHAPEYGWDDYANRDVRGRIVLLLVGDPPTPPTEPDLFEGQALTYYGRWTYKLEEARRQGAAGALIIHTLDGAGYPWDVVRSSFGETRYALAGDARASSLRIEGWLHAAYARQLFEAAGLSFDELLVSAARRDFAPRSTGLTINARIAGTRRAIDTQNVVGVIPGTSRRDESVVFTAHYDHLGIGKPVGGDSIYNGAYDNASGVGAVLEIARAFRRLDASLPRSIVFLFTTAEEAGLLGATEYVRSPRLPIERTVAAINIDGANLWGETEDYVALGGERSSLGAIAQERAAELGLNAAQDPAPHVGLFFRSDHFSFALAGVPAVQIMHGEQYRGRPAGWGTEMLAQWSASSYHLPGDDYDSDFDLRGAVQQARLAFLVGYDAARSDSVPRWIDGGAPGTSEGRGLRGRSGDR